MKILLITTIKLQEGSGDGITEYTRQLYEKMGHKAKVDVLYNKLMDSSDALEYARQHSWDRTVADTLDIYQKVIG
jgi:hypothetical protein